MNVPTILRPTITTTAPAYSANDVVGGVLAIPVGQGSPGIGEIRSLSLSDNLNQSAAFSLLFFKSLPAGTYADNGAFAWGAGDINLYMGAIGILATDYTVFNSKGVVCVPTQVGVSWQVPPNGDKAVLYAVLVTTGTPTYAANATTLTLTLELGFYR